MNECILERQHKLSPFLDYTIVNVENPKESTKKITTINITKFKKVTEYKVSIQKATVFIVTSNE